MVKKLEGIMGRTGGGRWVWMCEGACDAQRVWGSLSMRCAALFCDRLPALCPHLDRCCHCCCRGRRHRAGRHCAAAARGCGDARVGGAPSAHGDGVQAGGQAAVGAGLGVGVGWGGAVGR